MARLVTAYLVDTDILIDHLRGVRAFSLADGASGAYSVITRAELYAGRRSPEQPIESLLSPMIELGLDSVTANRAGAIRRASGVALPDAIIAATAIETRRVLMTRNRRHFERVSGLEVATAN